MIRSPSQSPILSRSAASRRRVLRRHCQLLPCPVLQRHGHFEDAAFSGTEVHLREPSSPTEVYFDRARFSGGEVYFDGARFSSGTVARRGSACAPAAACKQGPAGAARGRLGGALMACVLGPSREVRGVPAVAGPQP